MATAAEGTSFLESLHNFEARGIPAAAGTAASSAFDLGRMRRLLAALGDPQAKVPAIHVAGSKGKGSTVSLLSAVLRAAGYKVGTYTSPHMHHISERIGVGSTLEPCALMPEAFDRLAAAHAPTMAAVNAAEPAGAKLSHFEAVTALAFRHFADEQVDVSVIETGMGGITDATNVIPTEALQLAVITPIGKRLIHARSMLTKGRT